MSGKHVISFPAIQLGDHSALPLVCSGPHPDIPEHQRFFAPLIGSWNLEVIWYQGGSPVRREAGEWHFAWVLEGRGIQDVWIVPPRRLRREATELYEYGTSIRFYDCRLDVWHSTWIGPMRALVRSFLARSIRGDIVLETNDCMDRKLRWVFSELGSDSFKWQNFEEGADGSFVVVQAFSATRSTTAV